MPERIGPFAITSRIARGQLADVYLAERAANARERVAVKQVRAELATVSGWGELLVDEAALLATIEHPNLVALHSRGDGAGEGAPYVALEFIEGETLANLLERLPSGRAPARIAAIVADVLRALSALHKARALDNSPLEVVHQAPRPRHIIVGNDGAARLIDLSQAFARTLGTSALRNQRLRAGSMAPEHTLAPDKVDARADLFILGMTLWEALTGRALFGTPPARRSRRESLYPAPSSLSDSTPDFDRVCLRALERDPDKRFGSADEMLAELLAAARKTGGIASPSEVAAWVLAARGRPVSARPLSDDSARSYRPPAANPRAAERVEPVARELDAARKQPRSKATQELYGGSAGSAFPRKRSAPQGAPTAEASADGEPPPERAASLPRAEEPAGARSEASSTNPAQPGNERAASGVDQNPSAAPRAASTRDAGARSDASANHAAEPPPSREATGQRTSERGAREPSPQTDARARSERGRPKLQRERHERLAAALLTAALVFAMLIIGDVAIRKLLPPPEPPRLAPAPADARGASTSGSAADTTTNTGAARSSLPGEAPERRSSS